MGWGWGQTSSQGSTHHYLRSQGDTGTRSDLPGCGRWPHGGRAGMHTHRCPAHSEGPGNQARSSSGSRQDLDPGARTEHHGGMAEWRSLEASQAHRYSHHSLWPGTGSLEHTGLRHSHPGSLKALSLRKEESGWAGAVHTPLPTPSPTAEPRNPHGRPHSGADAEASAPTQPAGSPAAATLLRNWEWL